MENQIIYLEYRFTVAPLQPAADILMAELGAAGFESFVEEDWGILAYINKAAWQPDILSGISSLDSGLWSIAHTVKEIEQQNWNATWEENFHPILVDGRCRVRAPFHDREAVEHDIVIAPKMSFGTGHHETTHMMLQHILELPLRGTSVLDMGSGTGVLAILAAMRGAKPVTAVDVDHWCYLNARENVERNGFPWIQVKEGDVTVLAAETYGAIFANINRNVLLHDIPLYVGRLEKGGTLLLSGFYEEDLERIDEVCVGAGLAFVKKFTKNNWVSAKYVF
ncbi:50S ribosomal protein L11 methyltransferase [Maribacter sp. 2307ULW6-5]|uniref:50S ribosomal protein L11 methyltransferase n=1 Tax=Maribacter sp. 2307ULW6-5 TaxID=3386275 RepID=UPI0039BC8D32